MEIPVIFWADPIWFGIRVALIVFVVRIAWGFGNKVLKVLREIRDEIRDANVGKISEEAQEIYAEMEHEDELLTALRNIHEELEFLNHKLGSYNYDSENENEQPVGREVPS